MRRWLRDGQFDLVHLHEPVTPSISLLALRFAAVPVVATYHTATPRSRTMQVAGDALRRLIEKIDAGIAVSEPARDVVVRHLGRDAVVIPNGFDHASFRAAPARSGPSAWRGGDRPRLTFLGRLDEPRKGLPVLLAALPAIRAAVGDVEVCLAGHGSAPARTAGLPRRSVAGRRAGQARLLAGDRRVRRAADRSGELRHRRARGAGGRRRGGRLGPAGLRRPARPQRSARLGHLFRRGDAGGARAGRSLAAAGRRRPAPTGRRRATRRYDWSAVGPRPSPQVYGRPRRSEAVVGSPDRLDLVGAGPALIRRARRARRPTRWPARPGSIRRPAAAVGGRRHRGRVRAYRSPIENVPRAT